MKGMAGGFMLAVALVLLSASETTDGLQPATRGPYLRLSREIDDVNIINVASGAEEDECKQVESAVHTFIDGMHSNLAECRPKIYFDNCYQVKFVNGGSGVYRIAGRDAWCDMLTDNGGWQVILRRADGQTNFRKKWSGYQSGFGLLHEDFWMGLDAMHELTTKTNMDLRVDLRYANGTELFALYHNFSVAGPSDDYRLTVGVYDASSTVEDSLSHHDQMAFTTKDRDNDELFPVNCAKWRTGGWWFRGCGIVHLTKDLFFDPDRFTNYKGVLWFRRSNLSISYFRWVEMKIRPAAVETQGSVNGPTLEIGLLDGAGRDV